MDQRFPGSIMETLKSKKRRFTWARHQQRWWGKWHLYIGLIAGFILSVTGLTGSILVFRNEIDQALNPELFRVQGTGQPLSYEEIWTRVKQQNPQLKIEYISRTDKTSDASFAVHEESTGKDYYIHPYTGKLIRARAITGSFTGFVQELHESLLIPVAGKFIVGFSALALLILNITGLRLWWPKAGQKIKSALSINFRGGFKRANYDLHKTIGLLGSPFIAMSSLTGIAISFGFVVLPLLFVLNGQSPALLVKIFQPVSIQKKHQKPLSLTQILHIAAREFPNLYIDAVAMPKDRTGAYQVAGLQDGSSNTGTRVLAYFDQYSGKLMSNTEKDLPQTSHIYFTWVQALHFGTFGGVLTRILLVIAGLIPVTLFITGLMMWLPRFQKQQGKPAISQPIPDSKSDFFDHQKKGFRYAIQIVVIGGILSGLYGATGGSIAAPVLFTIVLIAIFSTANMLIAIPIGIIILIRLWLKKKIKVLARYFALSLSFMILSVLCAILSLRFFPHLLD